MPDLDRPSHEAPSPDALDGNAAAGALAALLGREVTIAVAVCAACGQSGAIATLRAYLRAPGIVLRCPTCDGVVLRLVETPGSTVLDVQGAASLRFPVLPASSG